MVTLDDLFILPPPRHVRRVRRRPKDRKERISRTAAEMFSANGYYETSMQAIADRVGISAPALYRHYPNKYDMFAAATIACARRAAEFTETIEAFKHPVAERVPQEALDEVVTALIESALENREVAGLYRWQFYALTAADQRAVAEFLGTVHRRVHEVIGALRPLASPREIQLRTWAALGVITSIVDHRREPPDAGVRVVLAEAAKAAVAADLPRAEDPDLPPVSASETFATRPGSYEDLLRGALRLFSRKGYAVTSVAELAEDADVSIAELYRLFDGKRGVLTEAMRWVTGRILRNLTTVVAARDVSDDPRRTLRRLIDTTVPAMFAEPDLVTAFYREQINLLPDERREHGRKYLEIRDDWAGLVRRARPSVGAGQARLLVNATMTVLADLARSFGGGSGDADTDVDAGTARDRAYVHACTRQIAEVILLGEETPSNPR